MNRDAEWVTFCKRTEDPKLAYLEYVLTRFSIPHRRTGASFHAPILEVSEDRLEECWALLDKPARKEFYLPVRYGVTLDDVPDGHPCFAGYEAHDDEGEGEGNEELDHLNELERGYAQDRR